MERFNKADTGIFWDVDDCPIPEGLNALTVTQNMRLALEKLRYSGKVFIHAYGDDNKILDGLLTRGDKTLDFGNATMSARTTKVVLKQTPDNFDYRGTASIYTQDDQSTPLFMLHHSSGDKNERLEKILVDFMIWAVDNPAPANIILVMGDNMMSRRQEEFKNALRQVYMQSYNIHFVYPQNLTCPSLPTVHFKWLWESLSLGGNHLSSVWEEMEKQRESEKEKQKEREEREKEKKKKKRERQKEKKKEKEKEKEEDSV